VDSIFGITFSKLIRLLIDNNFAISIKKIPTAFILHLISIRNSFFSKKASKLIKKYANKIEKPPIFILGHWRSGTTFLHNLLIQDDQFLYPRIFEVIHPYAFLYLREKYIESIKKHEVKNRPMDNVKNDPMSAGEEEFAMAALTLKSPIVGWVFPKRYEYYERYLDFQNVDKSEIEDWKNVYIDYLEKINSDKEKTLILKSPTNTARIKILLEMFPNAKFINIHRNPYDVYSSTRKLHNTAIKTSNWQQNYRYDIHKRIINTYKKVYDAYFSQKDLIHDGNFIDISFDELENNTIETIEKIYRSLNISDFEGMKPKLVKYLNSIGQYKKNKHPEINGKLRKEIYTEWEKYFKYWNYS
jgi:hypothetical protein